MVETIYTTSKDELYHYGVKGMKWGVRHDRKAASRIYKKAQRREPQITKDVSNIATAHGGHMYGLEHRLKTEQSIARKAADKEIKDAVRYTAILSDSSFVKQYKAIKSDLNKLGYEETRCKNYFEDYKLGKVNHKSVQCNYKTSDGYVFEIQFQTRASQRAKDKKVPLYEAARNPKTTSEEKAKLITQMRLLADDVNDPPGIEQIRSH